MFACMHERGRVHTHTCAHVRVCACMHICRVKCVKKHGLQLQVLQCQLSTWCYNCRNVRTAVTGNGMYLH